MRAKYKVCSTNEKKCGKKVTKNDLQKRVDEINNSEKAFPFILDNNYQLPPIGKFVSAELVNIKQDEYRLEGLIEFYDGEKEVEDIDEKLIKLINKNDKRRYKRIFENKDGEIFTVYLDYLNFTKSNLDKLSQNPNIIIYGEKSLMSIPITIFSIKSLSDLGFKISEKNFRKIENSDLLDDIEFFISEIIKKINIIDTNPTFMFKTNYESIQVEFLIKSDNCNQIKKALMDLQNCLKDIERYIEKFEIDKIQFQYNHDKNDWLFKYFLNNDGDVIGVTQTIEKVKGLMIDLARKKSQSR